MRLTKTVVKKEPATVIKSTVATVVEIVKLPQMG